MSDIIEMQDKINRLLLRESHTIDAKTLVLRPTALYTAYRSGRAAIDREITSNDALTSTGNVTVTVIVAEECEQKVAE